MLKKKIDYFLHAYSKHVMSADINCNTMQISLEMFQDILLNKRNIDKGAKTSLE